MHTHDSSARDEIAMFPNGRFTSILELDEGDVAGEHLCSCRINNVGEA